MARNNGNTQFDEGRIKEKIMLINASFCKISLEMNIPDITN